jgi:hypothetical protein
MTAYSPIGHLLINLDYDHDDYAAHDYGGHELDFGYSTMV